MPKSKLQRQADRLEKIEMIFQKAGINGDGVGYTFCSSRCENAIKSARRSSGNIRKCRLNDGKEVYVGMTVCERGR